MKKAFLILLILITLLTLSSCKCSHPETAVQNAAEATCTQDGYTGDTVCLKCNEIAAAGHSIPAAGHTPGEPIGQREPSCEYDGYTGDIYCTICNELMAASETIPATGHTVSNPDKFIELSCLTHGYTGRGHCDVCGDYIFGEYLPKLEHSMENGVCSSCGYREPGMYENGVLVTPWEQLEADGLVELYERNDSRLQQLSWGLAFVDPSLTGEMVVSEKITGLRAAFEACNLTKIVLPGTLEQVDNYCFRKSPLLEEVVFMTPDAGIGIDAFAHCTALRSVQLPAMLYTINTNTFDGCVSLTEITLPATLTEIRAEAFKDCVSLTNMKFPASLERCMSCFEGCTSLQTIEWPVALTDASCLCYIDLRPEILYHGTQEQWNAIMDVDRLADAKVTFEYAEE